MVLIAQNETQAILRQAQGEIFILETFGFGRSAHIEDVLFQAAHRLREVTALTPGERTLRAIH